MMWGSIFRPQKNHERKKGLHISTAMSFDVIFMSFGNWWKWWKCLLSVKRLRLSTWLVGRHPKAPWHPVRWIFSVANKRGKNSVGSPKRQFCFFFPRIYINETKFQGSLPQTYILLMEEACLPDHEITLVLDCFFQDMVQPPREFLPWFALQLGSFKGFSNCRTCDKCGVSTLGRGWFSFFFVALDFF